MNVSQVISPSVRVDTACHHLAMNEVEMIRGKSESRPSQLSQRHFRLQPAAEARQGTYLLFRSSTCRFRLVGVWLSSGQMCGQISMATTYRTKSALLTQRHPKRRVDKSVPVKRHHVMDEEKRIIVIFTGEHEVFCTQTCAEEGDDSLSRWRWKQPADGFGHRTTTGETRQRDG